MTAADGICVGQVDCIVAEGFARLFAASPVLMDLARTVMAGNTDVAELERIAAWIVQRVTGPATEFMWARPTVEAEAGIAGLEGLGVQTAQRCDDVESTAAGWARCMKEPGHEGAHEYGFRQKFSLITKGGSK